MSTLDYKDLEACVARAIERSGVDNPALVRDFLTDTAGLDFEKTPIYRPYWVAGILLDQRRNAIRSAEGASFREVENNIRALKEYQWTIDETLGTIVPFPLTRSGSKNARKMRTQFLPIEVDA